MNFKRSIYPVMILLGVIPCPGFGQLATLDNVINHYAAVESILCIEENDPDSVVVTGLPAQFGVGDTVMIHCIQGAGIRLNDPAGDHGRDDQNPRNTGKYAFMIINEIVGNTVVFNTTVRPEISPMGPGEVVQLVRVPSYHSARVTASGVTAPAFNDGTGGVVALFVRTTLKLDGNIDVSGKGFKGAVPSIDYEGDCSSEDPDLYDSTFYHKDNIRAGKKGEGTTDTLFQLRRGKAMNINGGGGGNAKFSGGGGGSNYSSGGRGGDESSLCPPGVEAPGGVGGFDLGRSDSYYLNRSEDIVILNRYDRIFFGGGGGTGTRMSGRTTTAGGNGGGLVVIVADTIDGNNGKWIRADGANVTANATGAGGGGGGGGGIILDVSGYRNNLRLSAVGGDGGKTNHPSDTTGPGGGGGGGIYWLAGTDEPGVSPDEDSNGEAGEHLSVPSIKWGAADGNVANRKNGLDAPLRGFLFNSVPSEFWICADQVPETILASKPKGGDGVTYNYQWVDSSSTQNVWLPAPGTNDQQHYDFEGRKLSDTTYFRRIVTSGILPPDTSFRIAVYVHQAITGNEVTAPDTVCWGNAPRIFLPDGEPGQGLGPGSFTYLWLKDEGGGYEAAENVNDGSDYQAPGLSTTTDFARIAYSGVCIDTSEALTVTVFDTLINNNITPYDTICWNTRPDLITGPVPGGGESTDKRYQWESSPSPSGPWNEIGGITEKDYRPGPLTETTWYRRVALSGSDDACVDYSSPVEILNIEPIETNSIITQEQAVCTSIQPALLQGSDPGGGFQDLYFYQWESRTLSTGWISADGTNGNQLKSYLPPPMTDTTWYRRIVSSGGSEGVCKDTSTQAVVNVLPSITNNVVLTDDYTKCQFELLGDLIQDESGGSEPGGGATDNGSDDTRNYKWEEATGPVVPGSWTQLTYGPSEIDFTGRPALSSSDDYWYRRIVFSGPDLGGQDQVCSDTSGLIHITIHTAIAENNIDPADSACFNIEKELHGTEPTGEPGLNPGYTWLDVLTGAVLPDSDGQDYAYTFSSLEPHQFRRSVTIGECSDTSNTMVITIMELPGATLSSDLTKACEKTVQLDVDLHIEELDNYVIPWEVYLSDGVNPGLLEPQSLEEDGTVDVDLSTDEISTLFDYTIGKLTYTLFDGTVCTADTADLFGNVPIEVFLTPEPEITIETELTDQGVCDNEVSLVVDPDHGTGTWTSNYPDDMGFLPDPGALSVRASIDPNDSLAWLNLPYVISFTSEAGDCWGVDSVEVSFFEQPEDAFAGVDDTIYLTNSTWLDADPATAGEGTWTVISGAGTFVDEHDPGTLVYGLRKGERNEFQWTIVNGVCITSDDRSVITQDRAQPYEGFSPNGDGINDYFIIRGLGDLVEGDEFNIRFFNALGREVRSIDQDNIHEVEYDEAMIPGGLMDHEAVVWEGRARDANGPQVPPGTYYYVIRIVKHQEDGSTDEPEDKHYVVVRE